MGDISFNRESNYWLDVTAFEEAADRALVQPITTLDGAAVQELKEALRLYSGELLEGFYDDWALQERERLRLLYLDCLAYLMRYYKYHEAYEESLAYGQQILRQDPLREEIHREVMRLYIASGQRAMAARQYETCCQILAAELGIPPMAETQMLHTQIIQAGDSSQLPPLAASEWFGLQQLLPQLRLALQEFDKSREKLQHVIRLAEQFTRGQS
jgi:two-component SAPR family response regulator